MNSSGLDSSRLKEFYKVLGHLVTHEGVAKKGHKDAHSVRVTELSFRTCMALGLPDAECYMRVASFYFHDWGKAYPPIASLLDKEKLTPEERQIIDEHTWRGALHARKHLPEFFEADGRAMREVTAVQLFHHKPYSGFVLTELERSLLYPNRKVESLLRKTIPLSARVVAVTDHYDAMAGGDSPRVYQKRKFTQEEAIFDITSKVESKFDPEIVRVFVEQVLGINLTEFTEAHLETNNVTRLSSRPN